MKITRIHPAFSVLGALCLTLGTLHAQTTLTNNLVGYWPFDTTDGVSTPDLALGNSLFLSNSPSLLVGERGNCFQFDGASQYLILPHSTDFLATGLPIYNTNAYTVAFWVRGLSTQAANKIIFCENAVNNVGLLWEFNTSGTKIRVNIRGDDNATHLSNKTSTGNVFDTNGITWHHIGWVDAHGTATLYIDGVPDATSFNYTPVGGPPTGNILSVGALIRSTVGNYFNGAVDEVMAWRRALTQTEIQSVMSNGIPEPILPTPPTFVTPLANSTNAMGDRLIFSANVFGNQPMTYQWFTNNVLVPGQSANSLVLANLTTQAGTNTISLVASNIAGTNADTVTVVVLPDPPATNIDFGLVGDWPFETLSNSATMSPELTSRNDMQMTNMTAANLVPAQYGADALSFDGATQYGSETTGTPIYQFSTTYSVAFWVNGAGEQSGYHVIFANGNPTNGDYFLIGNDPSGATGGLDVRPNPGTGDIVSSNTALDSTWHHVAWVDQNGTGLLYIDGVLDPTVYNYTRSGSISVSNTTVGALWDSGSPQYYFAGNIQQLGNWSRRLTYTEIQAIIAGGIPTPPTILKPSVSAPRTNWVGAVYQGDTISMSVSASGTPPLSYQWYVGTNAISGLSNPTALTNTLVLANVQPGQSGSYSVVVTNVKGAVTSSVVPLTVVPYVPATNGTVLKVEFNYAAGPVVQPGFSSMTLSGNPASFDGPSITLSPIGVGLADSTRPVPTNNPPILTTADIYQQFIFNYTPTAGAGLEILIQRLAPNTTYGLMIWSYGQDFGGSSQWVETNSNTTIDSDYIFSSSAPPTMDFNDTFGSLVTSSASGQLDIQGTSLGSATAPVLVNAIQLTANPTVQITEVGIAQDGNLQVIVQAQFPGQTVSLQETAGLAAVWQPANDATQTAQTGPLVTFEIPISAKQQFFRAVAVP